MANGGLTLVANIFDTVGDDAPNDTEYVVSGWQQTESGLWAHDATQVARDSSGTGSAAVSLAFVAALKASANQQNLKFCFVSQDGVDTTCRNSADLSLTLVSYSTGNPQLTDYVGNTLTYTYGRLAGLAGSVATYDSATFAGDGTTPGFQVPRVFGSISEFGDDSSRGFGERPSTVDDLDGVWHLWGLGMSYKPWTVDNFELAGRTEFSPTLANPVTSTSGFRLYVGP